MMNKCNAMGLFMVFLYFTTLIMLSLAFNANPETQAQAQRQVHEAQDELKRGTTAWDNLKRELEKAADFIKDTGGSIAKVIGDIEGYIDIGVEVLLYVMVAVVIGSILLCIISPIVYIVATLITAINKCIRKCKNKEGQESPEYIKLNERISYIEVNNGIRPPMDKNSNDPGAVGGESQIQQPSSAKNVKEGSGGGTTGAGGTTGGTTGADTVDGKSGQQQKS